MSEIVHKTIYKDLICETNTETQYDPANNEDDKAICQRIQDCANNEENPSNQHSQLAAQLSCDRGGYHGGYQSCKVERGCEQLKVLIVIFAVVAFFPMLLCPYVYFWEEPLQKTGH